MRRRDPRELPVCASPPRIMHIDLNSCFATIEQQANRLLRGRPIGVAAYDTPRGFVLAASYEAKRLGIKLGVNNQEARLMCPGIVILTPDPSKYREAHRRFKQLLTTYTNDVSPKSIDEFVLDMAGSPALRRGMGMEDIAREIKQKITASLGEAVTVNIGIAPNRFLAKYAAGFDKPDGLTTIDHTNLRSRYRGMDLVDLPGINIRYKARLVDGGIHTPLQFLDADRRYLHRVIFKSIVGEYWYKRLRGWEADDRAVVQRSIGHQYALGSKTADRDELNRSLMKLCEKTGRRLRKGALYARGIHLYLSFAVPYDHPDIPASFENMPRLRRWHLGRRLSTRLYSTQDIYLAAKNLMDCAIIIDKVKLMAVTVYDLAPWEPEQLGLFEDNRLLSSSKRLSDALDTVNNRYGEFVVTPATMMDMNGTILDRIAFGQVRDL